MVASPKQLTKLAIDSILEATIFFSFTNVGFHVRSRIFHWQNFWNKTERSLDGKTVVVTGATGGLGSEMAIAFAKAGATVWVTGRNKAGLETLKATIDAEVPGASINTYQLDLASLDAVRDFAQTLNSQLKSLDVLIHNAGALVHKFDSTEDGIEITAQVHVVAPFVLTSELLPLLNATPDSRVLTTSSGGMYTKAVTSKSLDCSEANFNGSGAYAMAKRAQIDLTKKWSQLPSLTQYIFIPCILVGQTHLEFVKRCQSFIVLSTDSYEHHDKVQTLWCGLESTSKHSRPTAIFGLIEKSDVQSSFPEPELHKQM